MAFPLPIPDAFETDRLPAGHKIGSAAYLFTQIKPDMEVKWREEFGGDEARRQRQEKAEKAAKKKAEKERKKQSKNKEKEKEKEAAVTSRSVEAAEKNGSQALDNPKDAVEEVTEGVKQTVLQTS